MYVLFYLVWGAFLIALPLAWLAAIFFVARFIATKLPHSASISIYAVALVIATGPIAWSFYGWSQFRNACSQVRPLQQFSRIEPQQSLLVRLDLGFDFGKSLSMDIGSILKRVGEVCIENEFWRPITDPQTGQTFRFERRCGSGYARSNELSSHYALTVNKNDDGTGLGYLLAYRVQDIKDKTTVAEAQEALFGRGLIKQYVGFFSGSNNPEFLACGYVDRSPHIWRSTRGGLGSKQYDAYVAADSTLFLTALGRTSAR